MPDYHALYLKMASASADAIELLQNTTAKLIAAQQEAEQILLDAPEPDIVLFSRRAKKDSDPDNPSDTPIPED